MTRKFTGWHMTALLIGFFALVIAVNFGMAWTATRGFGGVVVENSYIASQDYNRWIDEQRREDALGWKAVVSRDEEGRLVVATQGIPADAVIVAYLRRPLGPPEDRTVALVRIGPDHLRSERAESGRWIVRLEADAGGKRWSHEVRLR